MEKKLEELTNDVREIRNALIGNKDLGHKGLVHKVNSHDEYIHNDRKLKAKALGIFIGLQAVWAIIVAWLKFK